MAPPTRKIGKHVPHETMMQSLRGVACHVGSCPRGAEWTGMLVRRRVLNDWYVANWALPRRIHDALLTAQYIRLLIVSAVRPERKIGPYRQQRKAVQ